MKQKKPYWVIRVRIEGCRKWFYAQIWIDISDPTDRHGELIWDKKHATKFKTRVAATGYMHELWPLEDKCYTYDIVKVTP